MKRFFVTLVACAGTALFAVPAALAANGFTLSGTAQTEGDHVKLVSDFSDNPGVTSNDQGAINFSVPAGLKFSGLTALSTQFNVTDDDCGGGSPRFQINVDGKNIFVYLGPSPNFTGCAKNTWLSSGNLVGTSDQCRVDTSQLISGTQCTTWAAAIAALGSHTVTEIQLVADGGLVLQGTGRPGADRSGPQHYDQQSDVRDCSGAGSGPGQGEVEPSATMRGPARVDGYGGLQRALGHERQRPQRVRQVRFGDGQGSERR